MNLETRKIKFVQSFLNPENESAVAYLEQTLISLKNEDIQPMTTDELNKRIDKSEADFENGKFKRHSDLKDK